MKSSFLKYCFCSIACLLSGCSCSSSNVDPEPSSIDSQLVGLDVQAVEAKLNLGQPHNEENFQVQDISDEFRIEILNVYDPANPDQAIIVIREFTWVDGDYFITAWFHLEDGEWICFDSVKWHKNIRF